MYVREDSAKWSRGPTLNRDQFGSFFHGTSARLNPGDILVPGGGVGQHNYRTSSSEHVYSTTDEDKAWHFANSVRERRIDLYGDDEPERHVYEVEPEGDLHKDPEIPEDAYRSLSARVIREIPGPRGAQLRLGGGYATPAEQKREAERAALAEELRKAPSEADRRLAFQADVIHEFAQGDLFGEKKPLAGLVRTFGRTPPQFGDGDDA
jgi:hypothetical protein